jgi:hypothetical protein
MSILQKLTEGVQSRDMQAEGAALLNKWEATGLLEGLNEGQAKQGMAVLLENQAKELLREASSMAAGDVEGFAAVAFPIVRRVFGGLIANDLISVQPMSLPSGLIFFLDFTHEGGSAGFGAGTSLYGGGVTGKGIVDGVKDISETGFYGLRHGYSSATIQVAIDQPTACAAVANPENSKTLDFDPDLKGKLVFTCAPIDAEVTTTLADMASLDPAGARALAFADRTVITPDRIATNSAGFRTLQADDGDLIVAVCGDGGTGNTATSLGGLSIAKNTGAVYRFKPVRRLASFAVATNTDGLKAVSDGKLFDRLVFECVGARNNALGAIAGDADAVVGAAFKAITAATIKTAAAVSGLSAITAANGALVVKVADLHIDLPARDDLAAQGLGAIRAGEMPLEEPVGNTGNTSGADGTKNSIAEIDIKVDSIAVTAQTKKLKAKWSPELGQDLNAYHNLDAEVELTGILSEQIALEIDRELLGELVDGATASTRYWSRMPGAFVDSTGLAVGANAAAPDFTGTVSEWYETLIETINDVSAQIHRKTLRGGANFVVCGPEVANILEFTSGFRASVTADQDRGTIGAVRAGSLSKKFDVYVDPYFLRNVILVGRKGSSFLESGYVYAPYVPLQVTPTIFGTEDFVPRKGVMTRYAKKMVRPDMYGLVVVRSLLGESITADE